ncbi:MAG: HD domain-containing protein [bacterium]|nr:HD domain-containing protein [bacterium]
MAVTLKDVASDPVARAYIEEADRVLSVLGFTEHGIKHSTIVSARAKTVLLKLGYKERRAELAAIAGFLHDIGNVVNRYNHEIVGATIAADVLRSLGMDAIEIAPIMTAVGNHDEGSGEPVSALTAGLTLADKSDVRRDRVRNRSMVSFDIHDRVNFAVMGNELVVDPDGKIISLALKIDNSISGVMDYFEIFIGRMVMCRKAAQHLGCGFKLLINDVEML